MGIGFGLGSGGTSARLAFFDDRSNLSHKQEDFNDAYNNGKCKDCPRKANKQRKAKGTCFLKKIGFK